MQKRDGYSNIKSLLLEKKAKETLSLDKAIYSTQEEIGNIFGPLSRIWVFLGGQKNAAHEQISQIEYDILEDVTEMFTTAKDCCCIMDMSITMIGQAYNFFSYYRRRNVFMAIMGDKKKVKDNMSENKDIIQENSSKHLFTEKLNDKITEHVKLKKKSREFFNIIENKQPNNSINNSNNHQPFQRCPLLQQDRGRGRSNFFSYHQNDNKLCNSSGKSKFISYFLCIPSASPVNARISKGT